ERRGFAMRGFCNTWTCPIRFVWVAVLSLSVMSILQSAGLCQQQEEINIQANGQFYVNPAGNGRFRVNYSFSPPRAYDRIKRNYPNLYVLFRDFGVNRASVEVIRSSFKIASDDGARTITFVGDMLGVTECRGDKWYLDIPKKEKIVTRVGNHIFT